MAQDYPNTTTRPDSGSARDTAGGKTDVTERERGFESRRDVGTREATGRRNVPRRTPYYGQASSPFSLVRRMADEIDRVFSEFDMGRVGFGHNPRATLEPWRYENRLADASWIPTLETFRKDEKIVVRADLPGLTKDDIDIEVEDDMLTISGERSEETRDDRDDFYRTERTYGRFFRAIPLPDGVEADKIDAAFTNGVLEVTIPTPKVQTPRNRQVKIR